MSEDYLSDGGPGWDLFEPYQPEGLPSVPRQRPVHARPPCRKCDGEGIIVVRVYPWDGCSYEERPCHLCNPRHEFDEPEDTLWEDEEFSQAPDPYD